MRHLTSTLILALATSSFAHAQTLLVVDGNMGPGTNYADILAAVGAAQPGDRIVVRPGAYAGFSINKPLSLAGSSGVTINQANTQGEGISIDNLAAGSDVMIRGFTINVASGVGIGVRNCAGRVLLDEVLVPTSHTNSIEDCFQVLANQSSFAGNPTTITRSNVTFAGCSAIGASDLNSPAPAFAITDSEVMIAQCDVAGGNVIVPGAGTPAAAIEMTNSTLTITDDGTHPIVAGSAAGLTASAIEGTGTLALDTKTVLQPSGGAPAISSSIAVSNESIPSLVATGAEPGGIARIKLTGGNQDLFFLLVGLPGNAIPFNALQGSIWLNPGLIFIVAAGDLRPAGTVEFSLTVTTDPAATGRPLQWLGIAGPDLQSLRLTNNAGYIHGSL